MDPANLQCFSQPHWRVIAQGFQPEAWFSEGRGTGTGGILMPKPEDLLVGNRYYRFANSRSPRPAQLGGGWWVDYENFKTITTYAAAHSLSLSYAARLFLALPIGWTRADRVVSAILEIPLRAYAGKGKQADTRGDRWTPIQHLPVKQLYIPGLYREGAADQLYERAFPKPNFEYTDTR